MNKQEKKSGVYKKILHSEDFRKKAIFINLTIRDASEAIYDNVHSRLRHLNVAPKILPKMKRKVANKIAKTASKYVPASKIATRLSEELPKLLMYQMYHKHGLTISAQTMFIEDAFIVIQLQVLKVDANRLLEDPIDGAADDIGTLDMKKVDEWLLDQREKILREEQVIDDDPGSPCVSDTSNWYQSILGVLPEGAKSLLEAETLPNIVQSALTERLQTTLIKQLDSRNLSCGDRCFARRRAGSIFLSLPPASATSQSQTTKTSRERRRRFFIVVLSSLSASKHTCQEQSTRA